MTKKKAKKQKTVNRINDNVIEKEIDERLNCFDNAFCEIVIRKRKNNPPVEEKNNF